MDYLRENFGKLILGILIILALFNVDFTKRLFSKAWTTVAPGAGTVDNSQGGAQPSPDPLTQAQSTVESYIHKKASPQCTLAFLDWSDFVQSGQTSAVTLRYRVQQPLHADTLASVRFTLQAGNVVSTALVNPGLQSGLPSVRPPASGLAPISVRPAPVIDRFSGPLFSAMHGGSMALHWSSAFSLSELEQAKAKAQAERKPLGFIMVWGQFFDHEADMRSKGSDSALMQFYAVFHQNLVLVFVRHETELSLVPRAVMKGFRGPDEGGFAPNMAVVDATATEFIVEIPCRGLDCSGRDELFAAGGRQIDQWLATHPDAVSTSVAGNP
jgi:hypothetical protein